MTQSTELTSARQEIHILNDRVYSGRSPDRAFAHWALKCLLADIEPDDSIVRDQTAISGPGDMGIDAWWMDATNSRLILVQAKDTQRVQRREVQEFRAAIEALIHENYVRENANAVFKEVYSTMLDCLYDESYSVYAILACGGRVAPGASAYCRDAGSAEWLIQDRGVVSTREFTMEALSISELLEARRQLSLQESPQVTLPVVHTTDGLAMHYMGGRFRSVLATVPASALAKAYDQYRSAIFEYNPRGPQVSKVNRDIVDTLNDDYMRAHFHLLNNGITIVCEALSVSDTQRAITMKNFQVVNGCQTVFTLHKSSSRLTEEVHVNVRAIEGLQNLVSRIAKASNSQTSVKAEQLSSLGMEHDRIATELDSLNPPWYYEKQMGQRRFFSAIQRNAHKTRYANRSLTIVDLGQFGCAFLGIPVMAKYDLKAVFERRGDSGTKVHNLIFDKENTGNQLLLPVVVGRRVFAAVKEKLESLPQGISQEFSELDWAPYARMHLVALVGAIAYTKVQASADDGLPPVASANDLVETLDDWFPQAFNIAYDTVLVYINVVQGNGMLTNLREFFRSASHYSHMRQTTISRTQ